MNIVLFFFDEPKKRNFHIFLDFWTFGLLQDSLSPANHTPCTQTSPGTLPDLSGAGRTGAGRHGSALGHWAEVSGRRGREGAPRGREAAGRRDPAVGHGLGQGRAPASAPRTPPDPGGCWGMPGYQGSDLWRARGPWESPRAPKLRGKWRFLFFAGFGLIK